jgi:uncharacterized membrane protein
MSGFGMGILRFIIRIAGIVLAVFVWMVISVTMGINNPSSSFFFAYYLGIVAVIFFGAVAGKRLARKLLPIKEDLAGITVEEEEAMSEAYKKLTGR